MQCNGVVGVYWLGLVGGSGELVRLLLDVYWDRIVLGRIDAIDQCAVLLAAWLRSNGLVEDISS